MNNTTEQKIEKTLKQLSQIVPDASSVQKTHLQIKDSLSANTEGPDGISPHRLVFFFISMAAAIVLFAGGLFFAYVQTRKQQPVILTEAPSDSSLLKLNAVYSCGGMEALDKHFALLSKKTVSRPDSVRLHELRNKN